MKSARTVVLFLLFTIGVCVDGNESVSVTAKNSVTLKSGVTEILTDDGIEWRFDVTRIAKISSDSNETWVKPDGPFRDRLLLDRQTGDLKISNIRITDSGEYKVKISRLQNPPPEMIFTVKVVSADEVRPVSLLMGDSVTLLTDLTEIQRDDVIQWRFEQLKSPVAEINRKAEDVYISYSTDGRFRNVLKLDQNGSLTITNMITTHSGLYEADISPRSRYTIHKTFNVTVRDSVESLSVLKGDNVTLLTGLPGIHGTDQIVWKFGDDDEIIADLNGPGNKGRSNFVLNPQTRDLDITEIQTKQYGDYKVKSNTRRMILQRKYNIIIIDEVKSVSVTEGETVTLQIDVTEIQTDDLILWMFEDIAIAEIHKDRQVFTFDGPDGRFRDRLKLDHQTGSLIITDTRTTDSGKYELKISSNRCTINRRITVTVDPRQSSAAVAGFSGVGFLLGAAAAAGVICYCCKKSKSQTML